MSVFRKDHNGVWYELPESLDIEFQSLRDAITESDFGSDQWFDAVQELDQVFSQYRHSVHSTAEFLPAAAAI